MAKFDFMQIAEPDGVQKSAHAARERIDDFYKQVENTLLGVKRPEGPKMISSSQWFNQKQEAYTALGNLLDYYEKSIEKNIAEMHRTAFSVYRSIHEAMDSQHLSKKAQECSLQIEQIESVIQATLATIQHEGLDLNHLMLYPPYAEAQRWGKHARKTHMPPSAYVTPFIPPHINDHWHTAHHGGGGSKRDDKQLNTGVPD